MRQRILSQPDNPRSAWDSLWKDGVTPWDLGTPVKTLISEVRSKPQLQKMENAFIPGCGSGYDLISLARYMDTTRKYAPSSKSEERCSIIGLEISPKSIERATAVLEESLNEEGPTETHVCLYQGDVFACPSTWDLVYNTTDNIMTSTTRVELNGNSKFDFIFDYLFFCALPPDSRHTWGRQMSRLLKDEGLLLTLMFPYTTTSTEERTEPIRGPPYPVSLQDYQDALSSNGFQLVPPGPYASGDTVPARQGHEMVGWWSHRAT
jgi:hypothetical protein